MNPPPPPTDTSARPPRHFWLIPLCVAALRAIPFLVTRLASPPPGSVLPAVGYNPIDWFAYAAFVRQAADTGDWLLSNPYATAAQEGRYILPLFSLLGHLRRWTGADPFWLLELARWPLIFLFFAVLWRFLGPLLPDARQRLLAAWLVGGSGGVESLLLLTLEAWPAKLQAVALQALSEDHGWSTFGSLSNPLWLAGLTCALIALRPLVMPSSVHRWRDAAQLGAGLVVTYYVHPYSGLVVLGVALLLPGARWALGLPGRGLAEGVASGAALAAALALIAGVTLWQSQDPVFRTTARRVLGETQLSVFWYPVTLGVVGLLALRGWRHWVASQAPHRFALGVWTATVILMHSSPLFNGYHFVFHLHLPLCIVAAAALDSWLTAYAEAPWRKQLATALGVALLFQSPLTLTGQGIKRVLAYQIPEPVMTALTQLAQAPTGKVYTTPHVGTLIPAYTHHRTYVGHWFLTPDNAARQAQFTDLVEGRVGPSVLMDLVAKERIDYVLLPPAMPPAVLEALRPLAKEITPLGRFVLVSLSPR